MNSCRTHEWTNAQGKRPPRLIARLLLSAAVVIDSVAITGFAMNVSALWMILATSAGVLIGLFTIRGDGRLAALLCAAGLALIAVWIIVRHRTRSLV